MLRSINNFTKNTYQNSQCIIMYFSVFSFVNFVVFGHLFYIGDHYIKIESILRIIAALMSLGMIIIETKTTLISKIKHIYWFIFVIYSIPFFATFNFLYNNESEAWVLNSILGLVWLILVLDYKSFYVALFVGIVTGLIAYYICMHNFNHLNYKNVEDLAISSLWIIIMVFLFSRKRELETNRERIKIYANKLKNALEAKTEFLNNVSHEIRTPMQGFTVISEGLVEHWDKFDNTKKLSLAKQISVNATRLASYLFGILDLAKFNDGEIKMNFSKVNLNQMIENIIDEAKALNVKKKQINFTFFAKNNITITADKERIAQVIRNIIHNSVEFIKDAGNISIKLHSDNKYVKIIISDDGVGIPENELIEIFKPFSQSTKTKTMAGGKGLGLAIASEIVKLHHGKIWAENNIKGGAVINISLPKTQ